MIGASVLLPSAPARAQAPPTAASAVARAGPFFFRDYSAPVPADWQAVPVASSFRAAQYRAPAATGASDAEVVVFYFGAGQGGSAAANIARWSSQFSAPDGKPVEPRVQSLQVDGLAATLVELEGSYARQIGMSAGAVGRPGQTLLAAVVETPHGNLTFQLHGDRATVAAHRAGFERMVRGLARR